MKEAQAGRRVKFFDTTLRDGEQSPGCSMNLREKLLVASHLDAMQMDVIEAGFAASSPGDFASVQAVAEMVKVSAVASLCRALTADIDASWEALKKAKRPRIHTFLATSPIHMEFKLRMTPDQVYEQAVAAVKYARNLCDDVQFSLEDASRSDPEFMFRVIEGVIKAGAGTVNIPDTVGYAIPSQFGELIASIFNAVPNVGDAVIAAHCHDDLGLAVANSLAAVQAGAGQVEGTINGIGERAGNAALEEVAMALRTRADLFGVEFGIDTTKIYAASKSVQAVTGSRVQANKAIVGDNAFAHEAGIHQHGVMMNAETYEIMTPESIGIPRNKMVLGKHSGRHAFNQRLQELGFNFESDHVKVLFAEFKGLADRKKVVSDADIEALARGLATQAEEKARLERFVINSGNTITSTSTVNLYYDGHTVEQVAIGSGPIDASFKAINAIMGLDLKLEAFSLSAVTDDTDAQGEANVKVRHGKRVYNGHGLSTDIVEASVRAYLAAINVLLSEQGD
ncbi:MAG: 2-isopropylmalate synthase [Lentisphaerae bacterium]|nr:2-isopropylmalate synthase [Lentisphaerota bacterium]